MDENSQFGKVLKMALGAAGLGVLGSLIVLPWRSGVLAATMIVLLFLLLFGGYYLWKQRRVRKQREQFSSALQDQTSQAPKAISDPNQRANLDRVRQKFQAGLQEFRSRGKDVYQLPWYVIIGESGSGKTEAIRHSGIDFPPGLQDKLQGSGGTINMDWWFTNRAIILDTAGSMLFSETLSGEAPEWREFLRLLKKARPHCPVNGLFLVLSVESLIKDSADKIALKASRIAQQLDVIQRALDVRFPVYVIVTKCDLLTGFREFFDGIEDPLLQHQMFGWSNPEPLDSHFRPDMVEAHLKSVMTRLRRRRTSLLRDSPEAVRTGDTRFFYAPGSPASIANRRLDDADAMFALPESVGRLAPRLRRYLETIFVAGEWSAKPVFLRGIYFTSSMREGKALDEAIALATGLPLELLPEDRTWDKNRAFFLRDLFHEKVFRESGLVTRATNTLKLLRQRQFLIFGSGTIALALLLVFSSLSYRSLKKSVLQEAAYWKAGATNWTDGVWSPAIVNPGQAPSIYKFSAGDSNLVQSIGKPMSLDDFHTKLKSTSDKQLKVNLIFKPMAWIGLGNVKERGEAQRLLFEGSVIRPLVRNTRRKIEQERQIPPDDAAALDRHREALLTLVRLEVDGLASRSRDGLLARSNVHAAAESYLRPMMQYLTENTNSVSTNLVNVFAATYSAGGSGAGKWPPADLLGGDRLTNNTAIFVGLNTLRKATSVQEQGISNQVVALNAVMADLRSFQQEEIDWLNSPSCPAPSAQRLAVSWAAFVDNYKAPLTNANSYYGMLENQAKNASGDAFKGMFSGLPDEYKTKGLLSEISAQLASYSKEASEQITKHRKVQGDLSQLDGRYLASKAGQPLYLHRMLLYSNACKLASAKAEPDESDFGSGWKRLSELGNLTSTFRTNLLAYDGPMAEEVQRACNSIASNAVSDLKKGYLAHYVSGARSNLQIVTGKSWTAGAITNAGGWFTRIHGDLEAAENAGVGKDVRDQLHEILTEARTKVVQSLNNHLEQQVGFPLKRSSTRLMSLEALVATKGLLREVMGQVREPAWQQLPGVAQLTNNCNVYLMVLTGLINDDNRPAEWELVFVLNDQIDRHHTTYRVANLGSQSGTWEYVSQGKSEVLLGKRTADAGGRLAFKKREGDEEEYPCTEKPAWLLVELLRGAERDQNGKSWKVQAKLPENATINLRAKLNTPLPDFKDWPE